MSLSRSVNDALELASVRNALVLEGHMCGRRKLWRWDSISYEADHPQGHASRESERRPDLREVVARQGGVEVAPARRPGSRHFEASGVIREKRSRQHAGSERDRDYSPLHSPLHL